MKLYIAVLDQFPDYMVPTLVAHSVLAAHEKFKEDESYKIWYKDSFKKCVVRVNAKEFEKISNLPKVHLGYEKNTLNGINSCAVVCPYENNLPNVLKYAKLWAPVSKLKKYKNIDDWWNEIENFGLRMERFFEEFDHLSNEDQQKIKKWVESAWLCANEKKD